MRPACDRVLSHVFGVQPEAIERFDGDSHLNVLDREHAIDMRVKLQNGSYVLGQEKALDYECYKYRTFTIEFWQNRNSEPKEPGEFFKIASQFYLHGYSDDSRKHFIEWKVIDLLQFMNWLRDWKMDDLQSRLRPAYQSRAAFFYLEYDQIPKEFFIAEWKRQPKALPINPPPSPQQIHLI